MCDRPETGGELGDDVAVRHPHSELRGKFCEETGVVVDGHRRASVLATFRGSNRSAEIDREQLHAVADAEDRDVEVVQRGVGMRRTGLEHRCRAAAEDDPARSPPADLFGADGSGNQLAVHLGLAHAARDQLAVLAPEIEDEDRVLRDLRRRLCRSPCISRNSHH